MSSRATAWHEADLIPCAIAALFALAATVFPVGAQLTTTAADTMPLRVPAGDVEGEGRAAQALFERRRLRFLPLAVGAPGSTCDERVGRFCTWYGEGEWLPVAEDESIVRMRVELVETLDSLQRLAPASEWLLGQRVWYRSEGGEWDSALWTARSCGEVARWWCAALEGFALHGAGDFTESLTAFERALDAMEPAMAARWRRPVWPVDSGVRDRFEEIDEDPTTETVLLEWLWLLADPLYLVDGNDRRTEHYSRWVVATLRDRARNPFHIRWGSDMDQLTVRHGWETGWERSPSRDFTALADVIGHKHPEGRDYMPPGDALEAPALATAEQLRPDRQKPRSLYAPVYAPVMLPMEGQLALFPRGETTLLVASTFLPEDTTYHADHEHALPWMVAGSQAGMPDRVGLFAVRVDDREVFSSTRSGAAEGPVVVELPTADYVLSVESWSPRLRRAGRQRMGTVSREAPDDVATLSDVLFLSRSAPEPTSPEEAARTMLPQARVQPGQPFAIGWEVAGLGFHPETLHFEVSVRRTDRGVVRRIGEFLRLADRPQPLSLGWEEAGPPEPTHVFHYLEVDLPTLDEGEYELVLTLRTAGRSNAVVRQHFDVVNEQAIAR